MADQPTNPVSCSAFTVTKVRTVKPTYTRTPLMHDLSEQHTLTTSVGSTYYNDNFNTDLDADRELVAGLLEALYRYHVQRVRAAEGAQPLPSPSNSGNQS